MATKTLTITEDAYNILSSHKEEHESFSQVITRELGSKIKLSEYAGIWSEKTAERVQETIRHAREQSRKRSARLLEMMNHDR